MCTSIVRVKIGLATRKCILDTDNKVRWEPGNYERCVRKEYKKLRRLSRILEDICDEEVAKSLLDELLGTTSAHFKISGDIEVAIDAIRSLLSYWRSTNVLPNKVY